MREGTNKTFNKNITAKVNEGDKNISGKVYECEEIFFFTYI